MVDKEYSITRNNEPANDVNCNDEILKPNKGFHNGKSIHDGFGIK